VSRVVDSFEVRDDPADGASFSEVGFAPRRVVLLCGLAGAGKTEALRWLASAGEQVLDLERLANHSGSVFGGLGRPAQPSHSQFRDRVAAAWATLDSRRVIWVEDEQEYLGSVGIPMTLQSILRHAPAVLLRVPRAARLNRIVREYGGHPLAALEKAVQRASRRLGRERRRQTLRALRQGDLPTAGGILLDYYDRGYLHRLNSMPHRRITVVEGDGVEPAKSLEQFLIDPTCALASWLDSAGAIHAEDRPG
jgi:tRNA 2-selenouridine synthase